MVKRNSEVTNRPTQAGVGVYALPRGTAADVSLDRPLIQLCMYVSRNSMSIRTGAKPY